MRYIETMRLENGNIQNHEYHIARVIRTIGSEAARRVNLDPFVPLQFSLGTVKCRVVYDENGVHDIHYSHYQIPQIKTLKIVECNDINYEFKYEDRTQISNLMKLRGLCDDIIITQNGKVSDSSFCNIILKNKAGLFTSDTPLLRGTKREQMIHEGLVKVVTITTQDMIHYDQIILVNAMMSIEIDIKNVVL